jgi:hypothetical protein
VKAFNAIVTERFNEGPVKSGGRRVIFVSGDHPEPVEFVMSLIASFNFAPVSLGGLAVFGRLQQEGAPLAGRALDSATTKPMEEIAHTRSDDQGIRRTNGSP